MTSPSPALSEGVLGGGTVQPQPDLPDTHFAALSVVGQNVANLVRDHGGGRETGVSA